MDNKTATAYPIKRDTFDDPRHATINYEIHTENMRVGSDINIERHEALPGGREVRINTSATGSLTIEQAEAFVEMVQRAIEEAKCQ